MTPIFVKLMMMTTSPHDGEALTAIRKANAILASANVNWEEFLKALTSSSPQSSSSKVADDEFEDVGRRSGKHDDEKEINRLFARAFSNTPKNSGFRNFLDSVYEWWEEKGFLTEKQYQAIKRAAR